MKRLFIAGILSVCALTAVLNSCDPLEPSTYSEQFYRYGTVNYSAGKASLLIDYTGENYKFSNFKDTMDMVNFEVKNGDRVLAQMTLSAVGNMSNNEINIDKFAVMKTIALKDTLPADTLNYVYYFYKHRLLDVTYPEIWSQGHFINIAPVFYQDKGADFMLYPEEVKNDTLRLRMYSYIPENNRTTVSLNQTLCCFDLSTLADSVPDSTEHARRTAMMQQLRKIGKSEIPVLVMQPDTMRGTLLLDSGNAMYRTLAGDPVSTKITLDF